MKAPEEPRKMTFPPELVALEDACTLKEAAFVKAVVEYGGLSAGFKRAYNAWDWTASSVGTEAYTVMQRHHVAALFDAYKAWHRERHAATVDGIVAKLQRLVDADPAELIQHRIGCCRHCHGVDFKYQRTQGEFDAAWAAYAERVMQPRKAGEPEPQPPADLGGVGFNLAADPNPACPECRGEGVGRNVITDTRKLSPEAAALYAGVKQTKEGIQVLTHSQLDAADKILRKLGAYVERKEISGPGGAPLAAVTLTTTDPVEASKAYREIMGGG